MSPTRQEFLIAVDFDGTIVEHAYPNIGPEVDSAFFWMKRFQEAGAKVMLWTMRGNRGADGLKLDEAVKYCRDVHNMRFDHVNTFSPQTHWTDSPKLLANIYIDDRGFGCPMRVTDSGQKVVDWSIVGPSVFLMIPPRE